MLHTWLSGILFVVVSVLLSVVVLGLVRRFVSLSVLDMHKDVAGFFLGVLGTIYAVMLAFVIFVVWTQYDDASTGVLREANRIADLRRLAVGFPDPAGTQLYGKVVTYAQSLIDDEWPAMEKRQKSLRTGELLDDLWQSYARLDPKSGRESALYSESLKQLSELNNSRRLRLDASRETLPTVLSVLLWGGGIVLVGFTFLFGLKNMVSQALMTGALVATIAFMLFLITALDSPFKGDFRISPEPIREFVL
ncbi:MAG TPA: DUF4239 domain-containing protein [Blastocatellia bacterium]|nr:DUF4239 domain-containing protein [Blastocatellia bacterium]